MLPGSKVFGRIYDLFIGLSFKSGYIGRATGRTQPTSDAFCPVYNGNLILPAGNSMHLTCAIAAISSNVPVNWPARFASSGKKIFFRRVISILDFVHGKEFGSLFKASARRSYQPILVSGSCYKKLLPGREIAMPARAFVLRKLRLIRCIFP